MDNVNGVVMTNDFIIRLETEKRLFLLVLFALHLNIRGNSSAKN